MTNIRIDKKYIWAIFIVICGLIFASIIHQFGTNRGVEFEVNTIKDTKLIDRGFKYAKMENNRLYLELSYGNTKSSRTVQVTNVVIDESKLEIIVNATEQLGDTFGAEPQNTRSIVSISSKSLKKGTYTIKAEVIRSSAINGAIVSSEVLKNQMEL